MELGFGVGGGVARRTLFITLSPITLLPWGMTHDGLLRLLFPFRIRRPNDSRPHTSTLRNHPIR